MRFPWEASPPRYPAEAGGLVLGLSLYKTVTARYPSRFLGLIEQKCWFDSRPVSLGRYLNLGLAFGSLDIVGPIAAHPCPQQIFTADFHLGALPFLRFFPQ